MTPREEGSKEARSGDRGLGDGHAGHLKHSPLVRFAVESSIALVTLFALTPIPSPLSLTLVWASSISNPLVLSADVTGAFGADADNQARDRLVLAFLLNAFSFGVSCLRFSYHSA